MTRPKDDGAANRTSKPDVMEDVDPEKMRFINGSEEIYPNVTVKIPAEKDVQIYAATFSGLTKQELMVFADDPFWTKIRNVLMLVFWVFWFGMLISAVLIIIFTPGCPVEPQMTWLQKAKVYQIFPRSFFDTDHDGIGDIKGITEKIGYLHDDLSVTAVWVNPFFPSKMRGAGYDVMNHTAIDERYGTMQDFDNLVKKLHKNDMRLIIDFVPNHTSKKHKWFQESRKSKKNSYANYYIWHPGYQQGLVRQPPNNWRSVYGGSAWTFDNTRGEFYLHQFFSDQPDLNLRNKEVIANLQKTLEFWMKKGVDAFHLANADFLVESKDLSLNEVIVNVAVNNTEAYEDMYHNLTKYQPETFELVGEWAKIVASHPSDKTEPFLIIESDGNDKVMQMYKEQSRVGGKTGIHIKIDHYLTELDSQCLGRCIYKTITSIIAKEKDALWPMWMVGDKYSSRVASRMGSEYVNAMNMLLMTLRGTPITYYGEEIGMIDLNLTAVNLSNNNFVGSALQLNTKQLKYDECRAPMQWTALKNAGFTEGRHTWLPIGSNYLTANVRTQKAHGIGVSHMEVYRVLSNLRPKPAIIFGHFTPIGLHESVFCFVRHYPRFKSYLIAINFGPHEATLDFFAASPDLVQAEGEVVATTHNFKVPGEFKFGDIISLSNVYLRPSEGIVIEMEA